MTNPDSLSTLHATYEFPASTRNCGGGGEAVNTLCVALTERGHSADVITGNGTPRPLLYPALSYRRLDQKLADGDYDVIHGHFSVPSSVLLPRLARKHDVPLVVTVMGADVYDPTRYRVARPVLDRVNEYVFGRADRVVVPSTDMQERVRLKHGFSPERVPHGTRTRYGWTDRTNRDCTAILTVCRLVSRKNLRRAVDAVETLRRTRPAVTYSVVGDGPQIGLLKRLADSRDWLTVHGRVPDLSRTYRGHDVFFLPSKHEAFGMVFVEALQSGLPVVTTTTGGQTDIVHNGAVGECVPSDSPRVLARSLDAVIDRYAWYQSNTRSYVDGVFDADAMAKNYLRVYRSVLND